MAHFRPHGPVGFALHFRQSRNGAIEGERFLVAAEHVGRRIFRSDLQIVHQHAIGVAVALALRLGGEELP